MVKFLKYIITVLVMIVIVMIVLIFFEEQSPERKIQKQLEKLLSNASKFSGDKLSTGLLKSKSIENLFAPYCQFYVGVSSFSGKYTPVQIFANSMRCRSIFKRVKFSAHDIRVNLMSPDTATVDFTGALNGLTKRGEAIEDYKELTCHLQLIEGKWLICAISVREIIKK